MRIKQTIFDDVNCPRDLHGGFLLAAVPAAPFFALPREVALILDSLKGWLFPYVNLPLDLNRGFLLAAIPAAGLLFLRRTLSRIVFWILEELWLIVTFILMPWRAFKTRPLTDRQHGGLFLILFG